MDASKNSYELHPLHDTVAVKPEPKASTSEGGLLLTTKAQEEPDRGTVVAVGPGRYLQDGTFLPTSLKVGDKVLYVQGSGAFVKINDDVEKLLLMPESSVIAKLV